MLHETGRAVFDLDLLHAVAKTQAGRSVTRRPAGTVSKAHIFGLSDLLYCAHCHQLASEHDNPSLRARLIGWNQTGKLRYRHSESRTCHCGVRSILARFIEDDFAALIDVLDARTEAIDAMADIAIRLQSGSLDAQSDNELEDKKKFHIAKHTRALKNNLMLFQDGDIDHEEYRRQKDFHERQMAFWEHQTTDQQRIKLELTTSLELVKRLKQFWAITDGEDKKLLAHSLFDEIVFDLKARRIVDFSVKSWAEPFLIMRAALYEDEMGEDMKNRFNSGSSDVSFHDPTPTQSEQIYPASAAFASDFVQFLELISFPQRSALLPLLTDEQ